METQTMIQEPVEQASVTKKVDNKYLWILAFIPLAGMLFSFGTWVILAINCILCMLDEMQLKKQGFDTTKLRGIWFVLIPFYVYKRAKLVGDSRPVYLIVWCLTFALSFITLGGNNAAINTVKNGTLDGHPEMTLGKAVEGFMSNVKWESIKADDGNTYVNVKGGITYDSKPVTAVIQYRVYDSGRFEHQALEFNEVPQSAFMYWGLVEKMFE